MTLTCTNPECGKRFKVPPGTRRRKTCSQACRRAVNAAAQRVEAPTVRCANPACGNSFPARNFGHGRMQIACSKDCSRAVQQSRIEPKGGTASNLADALRSLLRKRPHTVGKAAAALHASESEVLQAIRELKANAANVRCEGDRYSIGSDLAHGGTHVIDTSRYVGVWHKFGAVGDSHLCNRHERLDVLNTLYDRYAEEGMDRVFHTGNMIEGEAPFSRLDLNVFGLENQVQYWIDNYPQRPGITTYFVAGDDHEGWWAKREGIDIGQYMEMRAKAAGRDDLRYLGYMEADVTLRAPGGKSVMRVMHPGGGSSYAYSYTSQKIVEALQGGEKPQIMLIGHYHKADYCYPREVHTLQTGCAVDPSIFMRKLKIAAHVGGWAVWVKQASDGSIERFRCEWMPFYDRGFYPSWSVGDQPPKIEPLVLAA